MRAFLTRQSDARRLQRLYHPPVVDLGDAGDERLRGIFSPQYDRSIIDRYLTAQFLAHASTYVEKYQNTEYFEQLLTTAFARIGLPDTRRRRLTILDIGSGAGNSIFPLLKLCPDSLMIASDLSVELLHVLKQSLLKHKKSPQCFLLQLNAEELNFASGAFDLVVGAAVLHHLLSPEKTIAGCARILKRGGYAIFFEPFENGNIILELIYRAILSDARQETLIPEVKGFLTGMANDYALRKGRDKSLPIFTCIDDKWLFTRSYFWELAEKYRFSDCLIYPVYPLHLVPQQFELQTEVNLRLALGKEKDGLPEWAWEIIRHYDQFFSEDLKKELLIEGSIILRK